MTTERTRKAPRKKAEKPATPSPSPEEVLAPVEAEAPADATPPEAIEAPAETPLKEADPESDAGSVELRYEGLADGIEHGPFRFRPGQQVTVPSEVAEELLTWPHERFVKVVSQE